MCSGLGAKVNWLIISRVTGQVKIFVTAALTFFEENLHMPYHTMQPDTESEGTDEE